MRRVHRGQGHAGDALGEHGLADIWRTVGELWSLPAAATSAGPLGLDLTDHICQVEITVGVFLARSPITSMGSTGGIGTPAGMRPVE